MARVVIAPAVHEDLEAFVRALGLPADTRARMAARLRKLVRFPEFGSSLSGRWEGFRYMLGPWMLLVYAFDEDADQVSIVTIQDTRSARSATTPTSQGEGK